jgi:DNA-binding transcriptional MerR regulator
MSKPGPIPTEYTAIMTGEPFLHFEFKIVAQMRRKGLSNREIRELVKAENSFQYKTSKSIGRVLKAVLRRLDVLDDRLVDLCVQGSLSSSRIVTLFAIAKTNLLFFEFLEEVYREKCALGHTPLTARDVRVFFTQKSQQSPLVAEWSEETVRKLRQVYLRTMADSGLVILDEPVTAPIIDRELYEHLRAIGEYRFLATLREGM